MSGVAEIYDNLFSFESKKKSKVYPIHKRLDFEGQYEDLLDWVLDKVEFSVHDNVLDAGCGTGYSLIRLAKEKGCKGKGISISDKEVVFANAMAIDEGIESQVSFENRSYDESQENSFDKILAIESLKHSNNLEVTLKNICQSLQEGGALIIADDFLVKPKSQMLFQHMDFWSAPSYTMSDDIIKIVKGLEDYRIEKYDLTNLVVLRSEALLTVLIFCVQMFVTCSFGSFKTNLKTYLGGLILEKLYLNKEVCYIALVIKKITF